MNNYCIISHEYKFIYIPIAKIACTSLLNRVAEIIYGPKLRTLKLKSHRDVHSRRQKIFNTRKSEIYSSSLNAIESFSNYFKFAFARNPFDRIYSCYIDKLSLNSYGFDTNLIDRYQSMYRGMSFIEFLGVIKSIPLEDMDEHFRPQYTFLPFDQLDFIGKLETIEKDWIIIENQLGLQQKPLQLFNNTEKEDLFSKEAEELIVQIYKKDFEYFNYTPVHPKRNIKNVKLPLKITVDSNIGIHPFKDIFIERGNLFFEVTSTGNDPRIIVPHFYLKPSKGILFQSSIISENSTSFTLFYTTKDSPDIPESLKKTVKLSPGENNISLFLTEPNIDGRLRFSISNTPGKFIIKKICISEKTLPWLEDPEDLTEINKNIFSIPLYVQKNKNLFSMVNYASLYVPILNIFSPSNICEIGSDQADNTLFLADYCHNNNALLIIVDPIRPNINSLENKKNICIVQKRSIDYLNQCTHPSCVYFIDGDHNYKTVNKELEIIAELANNTPNSVCIFIHDISWPWAYRDLYYNPEELEENDLIAEDFMGVSIYSSVPSKDGITLNENFCNREGGAHNGVKKAIEDFLISHQNWHFVEINSLYGFGILWEPGKLTPAQKIELKEIESHFCFFKEFLSILEWNRIALYSKISENAKIWSKNQDYIKKLQNKIEKRNKSIFRHH